MSGGMTFTPALMVDPETGQEIVSYENGTATDHGVKEQQINEFQRESNSYYYDDENGDIHHRYAEGIPEGEEEVEAEVDDEMVADGAELVQYVEQVYGDLYGQMIEWAADNLSEEFNESYNDLIDSGNEEEIKEAMAGLYDTFMRHMENH